VCADTCDSAALVVSELVTNAIVHTASSRVVCELHDHDDMVRIAVRDEGCAPGEPHPSPQRPDEEHGRGLLLVDALCRAWGAQEHGPGLLVWAELVRQADPAGESGEPRDDLGWGAPTKPGQPDDSGDDESAEARQGAPCRHRPTPPGRSGQGARETSGEPLQRAPEQRPHETSGEPSPRAPEQRLYDVPSEPPHRASEPHPHGTAERRWYGLPEPRPYPADEPHRHRPVDQPLHRAPEQRPGWERP
jgi:hypothetical protein